MAWPRLALRRLVAAKDPIKRLRALLETRLPYWPFKGLHPSIFPCLAHTVAIFQGASDQG